MSAVLMSFLKPIRVFTGAAGRAVSSFLQEVKTLVLNIRAAAKSNFFMFVVLLFF